VNAYENLGIENLGDYYTRQRHNYFFYETWILSFSMITLLITQLFEMQSSRYVAPEEEGNVSHNEISSMVKMNSGFGFCTFAIMITSSQSFSLMQSEQCIVDKRGLVANFCLHVNFCRTELRSIISPDDFLIAHYPSICITLAMCALVIVIYTICYPPQEDEDEEYAAGTRNSFMTSTDSYDDPFMYLMRTMGRVQDRVRSGGGESWSGR
jgi:hypothetical protein